MNRIFPILFYILLAYPSYSQMSIIGSSPTGSLFVAANTDFGVDSLALIPSADLTLTTDSIQHDYVPITASGGASISRVYNISKPFTYSGALGLFYQDAELNGNNEATLQVAYHNNSLWLVTTGSTGNTATNYITNNVSGVTVRNVTAAQLGTVLPIKYSAFAAKLKDQFVQITWETELNRSIGVFYVESSADGVTWTTAGSVSAWDDKTSYSFNDPDLDFTIRYYRVLGIEDSGEKTYTKIAVVKKSAESIKLAILGSAGSRIIRFINDIPDNLQIYDLKGQLMQRKNESQKDYLANGIPAGVYLLRFSIAGQQYSRRVVL